jgi:hypothetical protein
LLFGRGLQCALMSESACAASLSADASHMSAVATYDLSAFAASFTGFARIKFVSAATAVSSLATFASDLTLFGLIHRCESAITGACGSSGCGLGI